MARRQFSLNFRRSYKRSLQQVEDLGSQAEAEVERHIIQRLGRLISVRRFVLVWTLLVVFLIGGVVAQVRGLTNYYQSLQPVAGGTYTEGLLGDFTNASPLYATSPVDTAVSKLIFASLFSYDQHNQLVGDLASGWSVDASGKVYTVHLKPNLTWQDGVPLTANDVVFTYQAIQNPDAQSPLNASWQGVTVAKVDPLTVTFTLPSPLTPFPYSLTNGIVPKHLLGGISMVEMRAANFNTANPVGAGPFSWQTLQVLGSSPSSRQEEIALTPFSRYHEGTPKLSSFVLRAFHDQQALITSFQHNELDGIAGLSSLPPELAKDQNISIQHLPLTAATMVFFNNSNPILSDPTVRLALVMGANVNQVITNMDYPVITVREPLLVGQLGYNPIYAELPYNATASTQALQADGWLLNSDGTRFKAGKPLTFTLYGSDDPTASKVLNSLQADWRAIGVNVVISTQPDSDLQNTVAFHSYDALLYSISIGVDPDVFAYWDSSQADVHSPTRLNLSEYSSPVADAALEGGRTRSDPSLRIIKYKPFLQAWQQDAPALGLYQPNFLYITREPVAGLTDHPINTPSDRFNNVQDWEIREVRVTD